MIKLMDFWASWCAPCKLMAPIVEDLEAELSDRVAFEKINVDENSALAAKFGVLSIPTYILEKDGQEVERLVGARGKEEFKAWILSRLT